MLPHTEGLKKDLPGQVSVVLFLFKSANLDIVRLGTYSLAPSGLYWVVPVPERGLTISPDGNTFTLEMQNLPVVDQPRWPALDSIATPARMTFKMVWKSTGEPVRYEDPSKHFRFIGTRASCQLEAQVEVPSIGFAWKSDPLDTSKSDFAVIGEEVNGRYYDS